MLACVADTNVWLRSVDSASPQHQVAVAALERVSANGALLLLPQNLIEFWVVATRSNESNGLGWTIHQAASRLTELRSRYELKMDNADVFNRWFALVQEYNIQGRKAHDARIAAAVIAHRLDLLVTFNTSDFSSWPLKIVDPANVSEFFPGSVSS